MFFNGKTSHTSTDGAVFLLRKNAAENFYTELVKVGENEGRGTICHAGGICPNGNYVCIAKITFDGNENIEKSVIYRSRDHGASWAKEDMIADGEVNPVFDGYGDLFMTSDGALLTYARRPDGSAFYMLKSTDSGRTWTKRPICNPLADGDPLFKQVMEGKLVEMSGKRLMCVLRIRLMTDAATKDCAVLTYSSDGGDTWTPMKRSATWKDLSSNNCGMVYHPHDGTVEAVFASRYRQSDGKGSLFAFTVPEEDALNDRFPEPERILAGAPDADFGYPSLVKDKNGVINLFYYNKDDEGTNIFYAVKGAEAL